MTDSYGHFDKPYRRGLVLGLSLAELFLILIFLLLLVAIGIVQFLEEEKKELHDQLDFFYEQVGREITVEEFGELVEIKKKHQEVIDENENLNQETKKLRDELEQTEAEIEEAEKEVEETKSELAEANQENEKLRGELEQTEAEIEEAGKEVEEAKSELAEANQENEKLRGELEQTEAEIEEAGKEVEEAKSELAEANQENEKLRGELEQTEADIEEAGKEVEEAKSELAEANQENEKQKQVISEYEKAKVGQDPPCWFVTILDADEEDGKRQKHVKIFDVLIKDDSFKVRWHDNSKITQKVDKGNENALPSVNPAFLNKGLREEHFVTIFSEFKEVGETKKIQSYKCRFMVDVFDETSKDNKDGYKYNLSVVENIFYKYEEKGRW